MKFTVNRKDIKFSLRISVGVSIAMGLICICIKGKELRTAYDAALEILSTFTLTFLGFIITSFTVFQMIHTKDWFEKVKGTMAFRNLLNEFKLLVIVSASGILVSLFLRVGMSLLTHEHFLVAGICLASFAISFLCSLAWKTTSAIVVLFMA